MTRSFDALGVSAELVATLSRLGITDPFPIQALTIPDALAGRDVCGKAKTGSGKTLAFGLPAAAADGPAPAAESGRRGRPGTPARVPWSWSPPGSWPARSPTCSPRWPTPSGHRLAVCYGGTGMDAQIKALRRGADVVVATPGRLIDLLQRGELSLAAVETVVLDEADRMADMGFLPPVEWILRHVTGRPPDDALLGHPRRRRRLPGPPPHDRPGPPRGRLGDGDRVGDGAPLPPGPPAGQGQGGGRHRRPAPTGPWSSPAPSGAPTA